MDDMQVLREALLESGLTRPAEIPGYQDLSAKEKKALVDAFADLYGSDKSIEGTVGQTVGFNIRQRHKAKRGEVEYATPVTSKGGKVSARPGHGTTLLGAGPSTQDVEAETGVSLSDAGIATGVLALLAAIAAKKTGAGGKLVEKIGTKLGVVNRAAASNARGFGQLTKGSKAVTTAAKEGGKLSKAGVLGGSILGSVLISKGGDVITKRMGLSDQQLALEEDARKQEKLENVAFDSELIRDAGIPADEAKIAAREEFAARNEMFRIKAELANQHMNRVQTAMGGIRSIAPNMQQPPSTFLELAGAITRDVETTMPDRAAFTTPPG